MAIRSFKIFSIEEKAILTWTHEQLYPRHVKAKTLLYTLVDERWDLALSD
jgi:hypothetical protein